MGAIQKNRFAHWGICNACITWGQSTGIQTVNGVCTDCSENISLQVQDEPNEYGSTIGKVQTDEIKEATATILVPKDTVIPSSIKTPSQCICRLGNNYPYYITSISDVQSNRNFRKIQLKLFASRYVKGINQENCDDQTF